MFLLSCLSANSFAESDVFSVDQFNTIKQQHQGQRWLLLLWSVDCPPCFKELAYVGQLHKKNSALKVILVNTDGDDMVTEEREGLLKKYGVDQLTNLHFSDGKAAQGRFQIDPSWYGELPRSYFYQADGQRIAKSGLVAGDVLKQWLL